MYVIYINDRPLSLCATSELDVSAAGNAPEHLIARYTGKPNSLLHYADMLEKGSPKVVSVTLHAQNGEALWQDFKSNYKWVPAAGGVVWNPDLEAYLAIYRRGFWDLPKGKIDDGEDEPTAALREVEEETGLHSLTLGDPLPTTYHTYRSRKDKRILKPTYWFSMETKERALTPETEEGIELARWLTRSEVRPLLPEFYVSLQQLLVSL